LPHSSIPLAPETFRCCGPCRRTVAERRVNSRNMFSSGVLDVTLENVNADDVE
jgi:hypothetical protein